MSKFWDALKDAVDFIDSAPGLPVFIGGILVGSLVPFKLLFLALVAVGVWAAIKFVDFD